MLPECNYSLQELKLMDHTDKVHLQLMTNINAVDDVLADIEPIGYTLKLVRIPRYVWIYDQEGVGEDPCIQVSSSDFKLLVCP